MDSNEIKRMYFTTGEAARSIKVNPDTVRRYCKFFNVVAMRTRSNKRKLTFKQVAELKIYHMLILRGFTWYGAKHNFFQAKILLELLQQIK